MIEIAYFSIASTIGDNFAKSFPKELKLAKVLPIFKSKDEQLVQNYRPISILPFFL